MVYRWTDCPVLTGMELGSYTSVSYTHLDVYKRQAPWRSTPFC